MKATKAKLKGNEAKKAPRIACLNMRRPPGFWAGGLGYLPSKGKRQAAQGAEHTPSENMLPRQCITLGATEVCPCLCTAVEVAVVRQGAGEGDCAGASDGGQTGPAQKFRV